MRFLSLTASLLACTATVASQGLHKGFNIGANNPDGSCKSEADWRNAFQKLKALPGSFTTVRQYASSDCNTLAASIPAAKAVGTKILVGVWTEDEAHYTAEKNALTAAIRTHGSDWIYAISVGSEDLYRKETSAARLAQQINEVRSIVRGLKVNAPVGHVDTWTAWVDGANDAVTRAVDFVGMDGYPYFQGATIDDAAKVFWKSVDDTKGAVARVKPGTPVWITETSWPVSGPNFGAAVPSLKSAERYWKEVGCGAINQLNVFWYAYEDWNASPSFGIIGKDQKPVHDMRC